MPPANPQQSPTPMGIVNTSSPGRGPKKGLLIAIFALVVIALGIVAGLFLIRQNQNINEEAAVTPYVLPTEIPVETPTEEPIIAAITPTATPFVTPTASPFASVTPIASQTPSATETPFPIPETGVNWPTVLVITLGALVVLGSILIAL